MTPRKPVRDLRQLRKTALLAGSALLLLNAAFYALAVHPRIRDYRDLSGAKQKFATELASAEMTHKTLTAYVDHLTETKTNSADFFGRVLRTKQENLIKVQKELYDIGQEFKINPDTVSFSTEELAEDGLEKFNVSVVLEGDYGDLRKFIARVENSEVFLVIDSVTLQGTKEGGLLLQMNIVVSTYFDAPWLKDMKKGAGRGRRRT